MNKKEIKLTEEQIQFLKELFVQYQNIMEKLKIICLFLNISLNELNFAILDEENKRLIIETSE